MKITISLPDEYISKEKKAELLRKFDLSEGKLEELIQKIAKCSTSDYLGMFLGKPLPTRAKEIRLDRLIRVIDAIYIERLPKETEISALFQISTQESKKLLQEMRFRYSDKYERLIIIAIRNILSKATERGNSCETAITSPTILNRLKETIDINRPTFSPIRKKPSTSNLYIIPMDTFDFLSEFFS